MNVNANVNQPRIPSLSNHYKANGGGPVDSKQDRYDGECASDRIGYSLLAGAIGAAPLFGGLFLADAGNSTPSDVPAPGCLFTAAWTNVISSTALAVGAFVGGPVLCAGALGLGLSGAAASIYRWNQGH
jgi:hypothetical protein